MAQEDGKRYTLLKYNLTVDGQVKRLMLDIIAIVIGCLIVELIVYGIFQPDLFRKGLDSVDWRRAILELTTFVLIVIVAGYASYRIIYYKIKNIILEHDAVKKILESHLIGNHFYTTDKEECDKATQSLRYQYEKIECYVLPVENGQNIEGAVPLYRAYRHPWLKTKVDWT